MMAVLVGAVASVGHASAATLLVAPAKPQRGTSVTITATGLAARRSVAVSLGTIRRTPRADASGDLELSIRIPGRWSAGSRTLTLRSGSRRLSASVSVRTKAAAPALAASLSSGERFVVDPLSARPAATLRVGGSRLRRRARISVALGGRSLGARRATTRGTLRFSGRVPALAPGAAKLTLRGGRVRLSIPFAVLARPVPPPPPVPPPVPVPGPAGPVTVGAAGDIACSSTSGSFNGGNGTTAACRQAATAAVVDAIAPQAVLALGDLQYGSTGQPANFASSYALSWGRFNAIAHPVPGDDDYEFSPGTAAPYFAYFGASAGDPSKGYYSYDLGGWHVIALNSVCSVVPCAAGSAQEQWLRADLIAHPTACTLAYWHSPRFTSGTPSQADMTQPFWELLYAYGAELVLGGNAHNYERFGPQTPARAPDAQRGVREFVVGTGGKDHQGFATGTGLPRPNSEVRNELTFGVLALTLRSGGYDWRFAPEAGATFTDAGSGTCH